MSVWSQGTEVVKQQKLEGGREIEVGQQREEAEMSGG